MDGIYRPRIVDQLLAELMEDFPAVSLVGPRASGKTTTALRHAKTVLRMDDPGRAAVAAGNPDAAIRGLAEPILIDEWQEAPTLLGAIKRAVDSDPRPGRFLLTGSVRAELDSQTWPGTGRVVHVPMTALAVRERVGDATATPFIERVIRGGADELHAPPEAIDLQGYLQLVLAGGFPEPALRLPHRARATWFDGYLSQLVTRDAQAVDGDRDPGRLRRFLEVLALNTAGIVDSRTLYEAAGINRRTAEAYERLLANLFVIESVPAWWSNRLKRLVKAPKRYFIDAALAAAAINADQQTIMGDAGLVGRLLDTFVAAQLRAELPVCPSRPRLHHLRTDGGRQEVDLLLELSGGRVIGVEVKASVSVGRDDARHLVWLQDALGERFVHGLVMHTGPAIFELDDRITAVPVSALWA